jgi:hypothetical protein
MFTQYFFGPLCVCDSDEEEHCSVTDVGGVVVDCTLHHQDSKGHQEETARLLDQKSLVSMMW